MKYCPSCLTNKLDSEYNKDKRSSDGLGWQCRECNREKCSNHYRSSGAEVQKERRNYNRRFLRWYKLRYGCSQCGYTGTGAALQFHHVRGKKSFTLAEANRSLNKLWNEMKKCVILCANCHEELHDGLV